MSSRFHKSVKETAPRFARYGVNVFGLNPADGVMANAEESIRLTSEFFKKIGMPQTLREAGINSDEHFEAMADHIFSHWFGDLKRAIRPLDRNDVIAILRSAM
ncbi:iron-containing alcohol dehydrogenase [Ruminobacter sp.]|uniref:iron-containing alcohol dehydrogenase n=1 Tax=Ruminobacter sp. TaxID=2774296 RepID=UPI003863F1CF